jgi:predicted exporter
MRWAIFCVVLSALLLNTGATAFAKSRNVSDNTRNSSLQARLLEQQVQKHADKITNALDQRAGDKLVCTNDEEDDLPVSAPARKQLQSILAYFLAAYLSQNAAHFSNAWQLAQENTRFIVDVFTYTTAATQPYTQNSLVQSISFRSKAPARGFEVRFTQFPKK